MSFLFYLQVDTNGEISLDGQLHHSINWPLDVPFYHRPVVAPLWCEVDTTRNHGRVYYRATTDNATLQRASSDVSDGTDFAATFVFIATWHDVTSQIDEIPVSKQRINNCPSFSTPSMQLCGLDFKQCTYTPLLCSPSCFPVLVNARPSV